MAALRQLTATIPCPTVKHSGNITIEQVIDIARIMRPRSMARHLSGTVKEILGTAQSVGCTVEGCHPHDVVDKINDGEITIPVRFWVSVATLVLEFVWQFAVVFDCQYRSRRHCAYRLFCVLVTAKCCIFTAVYFYNVQSPKVFCLAWPFFSTYAVVLPVAQTM